MARVQKGQSYGNLGFRVDDKGIATDARTGKSLSRKEVDRLLVGSGMDNIKKERGGANKFYDHNKTWLNPALEMGLGMIPGVGVPLAMTYGAAAGANSIKNPNFKGALMGAASGYGMGKLGGSVKTGLGNMLGGGAAGTATKAAPIVTGGAMPSSLGGTLATPAGGMGGSIAPSAMSVGGSAAPAISSASPAMPSLVGQTVNQAPKGFLRSAIDKTGSSLGRAADWAEDHKVAMRAGEGLLKGMAPPVINPADQASADRQNFELQRQKAGMGNPALSQQLQEQIRRLMQGGGQAALATPTVPGYNNYMGR